MSSFLLELFSEEIPARMQADAAEYLEQKLLYSLNANSYIIAGDDDNPDEGLSVHTFVTPRRLAIIVDNLPLQQQDVTTEIKGPKTSAPEAALAGFLKKTGLSKEQLEERDGVYFANIEQKGKPTLEVLKPLIEDILAKFPWPKSMRWGSRDETWVRPLHSILCILGSEVVSVEFAGVKASNKTYGHRFLAPQAIEIKDADEYAVKLKKAFVIAERDERKNAIKASLEEKAATHGLVWEEDQALLEEVVGLVEWPVIMFGSVDAEFMHLPPELLTTVMRSHQKYFTLNDKAGKFSSSFAFAANRDTATKGKEIIAGNERVLRARFSDAKFFFEQDRKKTLAEWNQGLEKVTFHAKIGTVAEKVKRIEGLCESLRGAIGDAAIHGDLKLAAQLCKADLVTGMVGEFPELQGIIGSYYAKAEGTSDDVCEALYHLYDLPKNLKNLKPTAQILCMADRLDSLISLFAIGEKPTGSKDPYALRRAALGVIAIIRNHHLRIDLRAIIPVSEGILGYAGVPNFISQKTQDELLEFFSDRLEADLFEQGIERTTLRAIGGLLQDADIVRVEARAKALQTFLKTSDSEAMLAAYKRAANILEIEEKKDQKKYGIESLNKELLCEPSEQMLINALAEVTANMQQLIRQENFTEAMQLFATLKAPLDTFFTEIMVNDKDAELRANRLSLLAAIVRTMNQVADFKEIIG